MWPCVSPQQELATGGTRVCIPSVHGSVLGSGVCTSRSRGAGHRDLYTLVTASEETEG